MAEKAKAKRQLKAVKVPGSKKPIKSAKSKKPKNRALYFVVLLLTPFKVLKFLKYLVPSYFKNSFKELRQVSWPSRKETAKLTFAVFMFAIVFAIIITVTDYGLDKLFKKVLIK